APGSAYPRAVLARPRARTSRERVGWATAKPRARRSRPSASWEGTRPARTSPTMASRRGRGRPGFLFICAHHNATRRPPATHGRGGALPSGHRAGRYAEPGPSRSALDEHAVLGWIHEVGQGADVPRIREDAGAQDGGVDAVAPRRPDQDAAL